MRNFALIIGAMKSGTTSLFLHMGQHPQVALSTPKEPNFFSRDENWNKGLDWYHSHWNWDPDIHRIAIEASPSYTALPRRPHVPQRISTVGADFRFIYVLRDPIERIRSHWSHDIRRGRAPHPPTDEVLPLWIAMSSYAMQLDAFSKHFPAERILLLDFADLKTRPNELVKRVCRFLGLDDSFQFMGLRTAYHVSRTDHPLYQALARFRGVRSLARRIPALYKQRFRNYLSRPAAVVPALSPRQCQVIYGALRDDMKRLTDEYGFDTTRWLSLDE